MTEYHHHVMDKMRGEFESFEERIAQRFNLDERSIRALVRAIVAEEVNNAISRLKAELNERGFDSESVRRLIDELQNNLLKTVEQMLDQRTLHLADILNEQSNSIKDAMDLINEVLKAEIETSEKIEEIKSELRKLDEETIEEYVYRTLIKRGILKRKRRKWGWVVAALGVLTAIVVGLVVNPILTLITLFVVFVVLMRW